jgi:hypothetical protein
MKTYSKPSLTAHSHSHSEGACCSHQHAIASCSCCAVATIQAEVEVAAFLDSRPVRLIDIGLTGRIVARTTKGTPIVQLDAGELWSGPVSALENHDGPPVVDIDDEEGCSCEECETEPPRPWGF